MDEKTDQTLHKSKGDIEIPWYSVWVEVLTKPSVGAIEELLSLKFATKSSAYFLIIVSSWMLASSILAIKGIPHLPDNSGGVPQYLFYTNLFSLWAGTFTILILLGVVAISVIFQITARIVRREGKFDQLIFAFSAFYAPTGISIAFLSLFLFPISSNFFLIALATIAIYTIVLCVFAIIAVYQMKPIQAIVTVLVTVIIASLWAAFIVPSMAEIYYPLITP